MVSGRTRDALWSLGRETEKPDTRVPSSYYQLWVLFCFVLFVLLLFKAVTPMV